MEGCVEVRYMRVGDGGVCKGYVYSSCLANSDNKPVSHSTICDTSLL